MKKILALVLLIVNMVSYGQEGRWKPFKLLVIQPDTALIDKSLFEYRDSVEAQNLKRYFNGVHQMERILTCKGCDSVVKEGIRKELPFVKAQEIEVRKFKYFQLVSSYSTEVYNFYFNEYAPFSTIQQLTNHSTNVSTLTALADSAKADYFIFYTDIQTFEKEGFLWLKLTTSLYAKQEGRVILTQETEGDTSSHGEMWTCYNKLSCLLINGVKTSTDAVAELLRKRQIRN
jgi:hypothetical protein